MSIDTQTTESVDLPDGAPVADEAVPAADEAALVADELLVEEVSIDGMCGVY